MMVHGHFSLKYHQDKTGWKYGMEILTLEAVY